MEDTQAPTQQERKKEMEKKKKEISVREEDHCYRDTTHIEQREMKNRKKKRLTRRTPCEEREF